MTIAERFAALIRDQPAALAVPELLPVQLATAAQQLLGVDGAGISVMADPGLRVPLGASDPDAAPPNDCSSPSVRDLVCTPTRSAVPSLPTPMSWPAGGRCCTSTSSPARPFGGDSLPLRHQLTGLGASTYTFVTPNLSTPTFIRSRSIRWPTRSAPPWPHHNRFPATDLRITGSTRRGSTVLRHKGDNGSGSRSEWSACTSTCPHPMPLATLRGLAYARNRDIDSVADDLTHQRIPLTDLEPQ